MVGALKDSKTRWLGQIPTDWDMVKVKDCFDRKNKKANQKNPIVLSLARSGVKIRDITSNEGQLAADYTNYNPVAKDDILINPMDLVSGDNCNISKVEGVISPAYVNLRYKKGINPRFYNYYFKLQYWLGAFFAHGYGVSFDNRWTLSYETLSKYPIVLPPSEEQDKIADFLDEKCVEIDRLSEDIQKQIDILNDYKKSVITRAVTKGLDPNAEMKDSGVEYIGEVPTKWNIHPIYYYFDERRHKNSGNKEQNLLSLSYGRIVRKDINTNGGLLPASFSTYNIVYKNDIIIRPTDLQNDKRSLRTGLVTERGIITSAYIDLRPLDGVNSEYYYYLLHAYDIMKVFYNMGNGVRQGLNYSEFSKLLVLEPSSEEQRTIVSYLNDKCEKINSIIATELDRLNELQSYKKSIIYEYVTGKKRVA